MKVTPQRSPGIFIESTVLGNGNFLVGGFGRIGCVYHSGAASGRDRGRCTPILPVGPPVLAGVVARGACLVGVEAQVAPGKSKFFNFNIHFATRRPRIPAAAKTPEQEENHRQRVRVRHLFFL